MRAQVFWMSKHGVSDCMSVKDWKLFHSVVYQDLDQPGFPETLYVSQ